MQARKPYECIPEETFSMMSLTAAFSTDEEASEAVARMRVLLSPTSGGLDVFQRMFGREDFGISGKSSAAKTSVSGRSVMRAMGLKVNKITNRYFFFTYSSILHMFKHFVY